jgi:hypothetical protein
MQCTGAGFKVFARLNIAIGQPLLIIRVGLLQVYSIWLCLEPLFGWLHFNNPILPKFFENLTAHNIFFRFDPQHSVYSI